jgi:altronate hydrolase
MPETFQGIVQPDGRVATRNYIGVISTVNCSASVARMVADEFRGEALAEYPGIDGIVPICHGLGCGMAGRGRGFDCLAGYGRHPNFAGVLFIGLGCEVMPVDAVGCTPGAMRQTMTIQEKGGTRRTIEEAAARIRAMLPAAAAVRREPVPASRLILGLECGGSDALSGITANPALGAAVDLLVGQGGTAVLAETPEIYGAEHLLTRRAVSRAVAAKLDACIRCRPTPSIKLATNTPMYRRMEADMDLNCGVIADGEASVAELGQRIFGRILEVASGGRTKSELLGIGNDEFAPWHIGAVM